VTPKQYTLHIRDLSKIFFDMRLIRVMPYASYANGLNVEYFRMTLIPSQTSHTEGGTWVIDFISECQAIFTEYLYQSYKQ
jgi:hypothetical protein